MPVTRWGTPLARSPRGKAAAIDALVRDSDEGKTKRLNAEIPAALHARVKSGCALKGRDMTRAVIELPEQSVQAERHETRSPPSETLSTRA